MSVTVRKAHRGLVELLVARANVGANALLGYPNIGNGGTAGYLRTNAACPFRVDGAHYSEASTDDEWNLSAQTDTTSGQYRAYWLYVDAAGTATIEAGSNATTAAAALAALPEPSTSKCVFGVYVAGPSTDFNGAGGLAGQGTIYNGIPAGACTLGASPNAQAGIASRLALIAS